MSNVNGGGQVQIREGKTRQRTIKRLFNGCLMVAFIPMCLMVAPNERSDPSLWAPDGCTGRQMVAQREL